MHETSMKVMAGVTFWVDGGEMMRYGPRDDIAGLTEIRLLPELAAALKAGLKARIQVFSGRGTYFEYTASLTGFTKAYDYIQRPFRQ
ncbi:MAG: invasion associated locus B family protein [Bryobacterales bacterium]|nr:invasion associated locus B family protein [Bryobacterales bacterium]